VNSARSLGLSTVPDLSGGTGISMGEEISPSITEKTRRMGSRENWMLTEDLVVDLNRNP
jgi:hypothetical protein